MEKNENGYNFWPVQLNETIDKANDGTIIKRSLMINIRGESPERVIELFGTIKQELSDKIGQETQKSLNLEETETPKCSKCGSPMVLRQNGQKGNLFYGCSTFPKCRNTMEYAGFESEKVVPF